MGGGATVRLALAVPPVPPSFEAAPPDTLFNAPTVVPVTFTLKEQLAWIASVAPESDMLPLPAVAVIVPPPHEPVRPFGVATISPPGNVSVNATPVRAFVSDGLVTVKLKLVVPLVGTLATPKDLLSVGGASTARLAADVFPAL